MSAGAKWSEMKRRRRMRGTPRIPGPDSGRSEKKRTKGRGGLKSRIPTNASNRIWARELERSAAFLPPLRSGTCDDDTCRDAYFVFKVLRDCGHLLGEVFFFFFFFSREFFTQISLSSSSFSSPHVALIVRRTNYPSILIFHIHIPTPTYWVK